MCFSPKRRTIFRHLTFKKCSKHVMFCTFSLPNVLFATAACNFWCLLSPPTSAPAALTGLLFDWPDTRIIEKTQHFATSLTFSADVSSFTWLWHYCIFCRLTWLLYSAFQLSKSSKSCAFRHSGVEFSTSELQKVVPDRQFFNISTSARPKVLGTPHVLKILTSKCAFRHSGVQFFDIWTSKSGPGPSVF